MPPRPAWYRGRDAIRAFLAAGPLDGTHHWRLVPVRANGQLAFAVYGSDGAHAIVVLSVDGEARIHDLTAFLEPDAFRRFELPDELAA
jgi:RNA polymerase sigma-70 factor (ECF subfamily)